MSYYQDLSRTIILIFLNIVILASCSKEPTSDISYEILPVEGETFLYFTDPHLSRASDKTLHHAFYTLLRHYENFNCSFCICGGDWLGNNETYEEACEKLETINSAAQDYFSDQYYPILGNHDTNYQGRLYEDSEKYSGRLTDDDMIRLMFNRFGKAYYSFETDSTSWFILDSGIDWETKMSDYRWEQVEWLGQKIQTNRKKHIIIAIHIYANYDSKGEFIIQSLAANAMTLATACNARDRITLNEIEYDFSDATGTIACFLCGHNHIDHVFDSSSIPVICTRRLVTDGTCSFDLCRIDWNKGELTMKRIGDGKDRIINIVTQ